LKKTKLSLIIIAILVVVAITLIIIHTPFSSTHYITLTTDYIEGDALPGDPSTVRPIGLGYAMVSHVIQDNITGEKIDISDTYSRAASIPGPILKINQYDTIQLTLQNGLEDGCVSVHVHGVEYDVNTSDGTLKSINGVNDQCANTLNNYTYTWYAGDNTVGAWPYHDHTYCDYILEEKLGVSCKVFRGITGAEEIGLYGAIIVEDNTGLIKSDTVKMDYVLYMADSFQFHGIQLNHTSGIQTQLGINPEITSNEGDKVRFTILGVGEQTHTFHLHGHKWLDPGTAHYLDTKVMAPMFAHQFEITAGGEEATSGKYQYHCHFTDHLAAGMAGIFTVI